MQDYSDSQRKKDMELMEENKRVQYMRKELDEAKNFELKLNDCE